MRALSGWDSNLPRQRDVIRKIPFLPQHLLGACVEQFEDDGRGSGAILLGMHS